MLGIYLALSGISYLLYTIPLMRDTGALYLPLTFGGRITYAAGVYFALAFTQTVFRSNEAWGRWLKTALVTTLFVGIGAASIQGDWEGYSIGSPWFWCEWGAYTLATIWVAVEALLAYAGARRRARLDLCEPIVANRYLLWGIFGSFQFAGSIVIIPMYVGYEQNQQFSATTDLLLGTFEILAAVAAWFVFFAPRFYREWIERRAQSANSVGRA